MPKKPDTKGSGVNTVLEDTMPEKPVQGSTAAPTVTLKKDPPKDMAKEEKAAPTKALPIIRLDVFLATKFKPDQRAGFALWAKKQKLKAMTMPEWQAAYEAFAKRPV